MSKIIEQLIESRIKLGNNYLKQSKVIIPIYEAFESQILSKLENIKENKKAFRAIAAKVPVVWTDITNSMIRVYNTGSEYADIKRLIDGEKSIQSDNRYGIYIFTDENDIISYVLAGKTAADDTVYVSKEVQELLEVRYDIVKNAKEKITKDFKISLNNLPLGTTTKDIEKENDVNLAEILLKCIYDFICRAYNNEDYNGKTYDLSDTIDSYSVIDTNNYNTYQEAYNDLKKITDRYKDHNIRYNGTSTDWWWLRESYRTTPDNYDIFKFINKDLLRCFMQLSIITVDISSSDSIVRSKYAEMDIDDVNINELENIYYDLYNKPLRNSAVFNLSIKIGDKPGDLKKSRSITRFDYLRLIPDKLSHLYKIQQDIDIKGNREFIEDFDERDFLDDDPNDTIDKFKSDDAIINRRKNFDTGIRRRPEDRYSPYYRPARNNDNVGGNQKRALDVIQNARRARSFGSIVSSQEREMNLSQLRRDWMWAEQQADNIDSIDQNYFDLRREISNLRTAGTIETADAIDILKKAFLKAKQGFDDIIRLHTIASAAAKYAVKARRERNEYTGIIDDALEALKNCYIAARGIANGNNCDPKIKGIDGNKFLKEKKGTKADLAELYLDSVTTSLNSMEKLFYTLKSELNSAKTYPNHITVNGIHINPIKYNRIPQVKFRKVFGTFKDMYDSVKNNTFREFTNILESYKNYYIAAKEGGYLNILINFYSSMTAMMEFLNDIISSGTFGAMKDKDFVNMVYTTYNYYESYYNNLYELTDALQNNNGTEVYKYMSNFISLTKDIKSQLKKAGTNFKLDTAKYEEIAKNNYKPNNFIPNYTRIVKN